MPTANFIPGRLDDFGANPTLSTRLEIAQSGGATFRLRDAVAAGIGYWDLSAVDFFNQGGVGNIHNHTLGLRFNEDLALATHPLWAENWEPRYVAGAPPNGLLEKNWDYQSIDRLTTYRPFNFNINLNDHKATMLWLVDRFDVLSRTGATSDTALRVDTANKTVSTAGQLMVGGLGAAVPYPFEVTGPTKGTIGAAIRATPQAAEDVLLYINPPNFAGGNLIWLSAESVVNGEGIVNFRNYGAGGVRVQALAGSAGDAYFRTLANQDWAFGVDRSDSGKWKLSNADTLGTNDKIVVSTTQTNLNQNVVVGVSGGSVGFFGTAVAAKQTVSGSRGANAALAALLTALAAYGLIVDSSIV